VPCGGSGTSFGFAIAHDTTYNKVWVVHDSAEGYAEGVAKLTTLVDRTRCLGIDMAGSVPMSYRKEVRRK